MDAAHAIIELQVQVRSLQQANLRNEKKLLDQSIYIDAAVQTLQDQASDIQDQENVIKAIKHLLLVRTRLEKAADSFKAGDIEIARIYGDNDDADDESARMRKGNAKSKAKSKRAGEDTNGPKDKCKGNAKSKAKSKGAGEDTNGPKDKYKPKAMPVTNQYKPNDMPVMNRVCKGKGTGKGQPYPYPDGRAGPYSPDPLPAGSGLPSRVQAWPQSRAITAVAGNYRSRSRGQLPQSRAITAVAGSDDYWRLDSLQKCQRFHVCRQRLRKDKNDAFVVVIN